MGEVKLTHSIANIGLNIILNFTIFIIIIYWEKENLGSYEIITFNKITFNNCRSGKDELITCILKIFVEYRFWLFKNA